METGDSLATPKVSCWWIIEKTVNTHLIKMTQRRGWMRGELLIYHAPLLCTVLSSESFVDVVVAGCCWLFYTVAPVEQLSCTLCTDGSSPSLCSITLDWRSSGTTSLWRECWTCWPEALVLRSALYLQSLSKNYFTFNACEKKTVGKKDG